nr:MAG TPA: hypothetical protein [Caudoviricetes sp.]
MSIIVYISMFFDVIIFLYGLNFNFNSYLKALKYR